MPKEYSEDGHSNYQVCQNFIYNNVNPNFIKPNLIQNNFTYNNFNNISFTTQENAQQYHGHKFCTNDDEFNSNYDFHNINDGFENLNLDNNSNQHFNHSYNYFNQKFSNEWNNFNYSCSPNYSNHFNSNLSNIMNKKRKKVIPKSDLDKSPLQNNNSQIDEKHIHSINKNNRNAITKKTGKIYKNSSHENSKIYSQEKYKDILNASQLENQNIENLLSPLKEIYSQEKFFGNNFIQKNNKNSLINGYNIKECSGNNLNIYCDETIVNKISEKMNDQENEDEKEFNTFQKIMNSCNNINSYKLKNFFEESSKENIVDYNLDEVPNKNNKINSINKNFNNNNAKITSDYYAYKFTSGGESLKLDYSFENDMYKSSEKSRQKVKLFIPMDEELIKHKLEKNSKKEEENELKNSQYSIKDHCGSGSHVNLSINFNQSFEKDYEYSYGPKKSI